MKKESSAWWTKSWGVVEGCTPVSAGCKHCYARSFLHRFRKGQEGVVRCFPERLDWPLHWRKPQRVFVAPLSDIFHEKVPLYFIDNLLWVVKGCPRHRFYAPTKRADRMLEILRTFKPISNFWPGISAENQERFDAGIDPLMQLAAAGWHTFLSLEPLLGPINLRPTIAELRCENDCTWNGWEDELDGDADGNEPHCPLCGSNSAIVDNLDLDAVKGVRIQPIGWVIIGAETGAGTRPCKREWIESIIEQCKAAGVPVWTKRVPADLTRRELPT